MAYNDADKAAIEAGAGLRFVSALSLSLSSCTPRGRAVSLPYRASSGRAARLHPAHPPPAGVTGCWGPNPV